MNGAGGGRERERREREKRHTVLSELSPPSHATLMFTLTRVDPGLPCSGFHGLALRTHACPRAERSEIPACTHTVRERQAGRQAGREGGREGWREG